MATVLDLEEYRKNNQQPLAERKVIPFSPGSVEPLSAERYRKLAIQYVENASSLLALLGEDERRVSWLLKECLALLAPEEIREERIDEN